MDKMHYSYRNIIKLFDVLMYCSLTKNDFLTSSLHLLNQKSHTYSIVCHLGPFANNHTDFVVKHVFVVLWYVQDRLFLHYNTIKMVFSGSYCKNWNYAIRFLAIAQFLVLYWYWQSLQFITCLVFINLLPLWLAFVSPSQKLKVWVGHQATNRRIASNDAKKIYLLLQADCWCKQNIVFFLLAGKTDLMKNNKDHLTIKLIIQS